MTFTVQQSDKRASDPQVGSPWWRNRWLWVAAVVVGAAIVGLVAMLRSDETETPASPAPPARTVTTTPEIVAPDIEPAELTWSRAEQIPTGSVSAVVATDEGFLAASHTPDGVEFWTSVDGGTWTVGASQPDAFADGEQVVALSHGPAGFVAHVIDPAVDMPYGTSLVLTSQDGAIWHRNELVADLPEISSPYVIQRTSVDRVLVGPDGFLAIGSGGPMPDFDLIAAEYSPGHTGADLYGVDAEMRPEGAVLIVGFGDEEELEIPFADLGITPEDLGAIFEGEDVEGPGSTMFFWWSADGATWEAIEAQGLPDYWASLFMVLPLAADDGFYQFAPGPDPGDPEAPGVISGFHSTDGRQWTQFVLEGPADAWMRGVTFGHGVFMAVGEDDRGDGLWTSSDARTWTRSETSAALFDLGSEDQFFSLAEVHAGGAGFVAFGYVYVEPPDVMPEPMIVKKGYAVTVGGEGILTVAVEETGELLAVVDLAEPSTEPISVIEDEVGLTFVNTATGDILVVIGHDEIQAAFEALGEELGLGQPPMPTLRYSADMETWTMDAGVALFGEGMFPISSAVGNTTVVAVVTSDPEARPSADPFESPATEIWVGRL